MDLKNYLSSSSADPKQILKIVLAFAVVMLVLWLFMVSRMDFRGGMETADTRVHNESDSARTAITQPEGRPPQRTAQDSPNIFFNAFTTFMVLMGILGLVWLWTRSKENSTQNKKGFKELGDQMLGQGAQLKIVEINNEIWVMGITANSVNLLHRYSKDEWAEKIEEENPKEKSFYQMLKGEKK